MPTGVTGVEVVGDKDFVRSPTNEGALVNTNVAELRAYKVKKMRAERINKVIVEQEQIKTDLEAIKSTLGVILEKLK